MSPSDRERVSLRTSSRLHALDGGSSSTVLRVSLQDVGTNHGLPVRLAVSEASNCERERDRERERETFEEKRFFAVPHAYVLLMNSVLLEGVNPRTRSAIEAPGIARAPEQPQARAPRIASALGGEHQRATAAEMWNRCGRDGRKLKWALPLADRIHLDSVGVRSDREMETLGEVRNRIHSGRSSQSGPTKRLRWPSPTALGPGPSTWSCRSFLAHSWPREARSTSWHEK